MSDNTEQYSPKEDAWSGEVTLGKFKCPHIYFDGYSAVKGTMGDKGFVGRCQICGEIVEQ